MKQIIIGILFVAAVVLSERKYCCNFKKIPQYLLLLTCMSKFHMTWSAHDPSNARWLLIKTAGISATVMTPVLVAYSFLLLLATATFSVCHTFSRIQGHEFHTEILLFSDRSSRLSPKALSVFYPYRTKWEGWSPLS